MILIPDTPGALAVQLPSEHADKAECTAAPRLQE